MTTPAQNKALLLEAFNTLFNRRDYAAAERFWSDNYIQHARACCGQGQSGCTAYAARSARDKGGLAIKISIHN